MATIYLNNRLIPTALFQLFSRPIAGYDPQFGARPLKRAVQDRILNPLSLRLLEGEFKPGDKIKVTANGDGLVFTTK